MQLSDRDHSPSEIIRRLESVREVSRQIQAGLRGTPFHWNGTEGEYNVAWAELLGLHLVTETQIKKRGYRLKRGAKPVGSRYFGAPISRQALLYVLECQAAKINRPTN
jgi:hypothetical protein